MDELIRSKINSALLALNIEEGDFDIEHPKDVANGHYSSNVAMVLAKKIGKDPKQLAQEIVETIQKSVDMGDIEKIELAGPGFINFYLLKRFFVESTKGVCERDLNLNIFSNKKILVEHSSPNLFKTFHIGHVMNNTIGEAICGLARASSAETIVISYPSDISLGISKGVWALMDAGGIEKLKSFTSTKEEVDFLGECYVRGTKIFEEDESIQKEVKEISRVLYSKEKDNEAYRVYEYAKERNLLFFKEVTKRLGSTFSDFIFESEAGLEGEKLVRENTPNIFKESEGAVIYEGEQDGLHTRVFINKEGHPTYEAKDVGLLSLKFQRYNPDISIFVTDHEQAPYFEVVSTAAGKINKDWKEKTIHRTHGRMRFMGQKMSSRLGGVPSAISLIDEVKDEVKSKNSDLDEVTLDAVAISALKFSILRVAAGKNMNFDPLSSLSFEGDSGPYLQYTCVRARSVLEKAGVSTPKGETSSSEILPLEIWISRYESVLKHSIETFSPHHIAIYLLGLAQAFNSFYANNQIIVDGDKEMPYRLELVRASERVLSHGLAVLGITTPNKM